MGADDLCNTPSEVTQDITVVVETDPIVIVPDDYTTECDNPDDISPLGPAGTATATSDCSSVVPFIDSPTWSDAQQVGGTCDGVIVRTWTATDRCGNVGRDTQNIFIRDTQAPTYVTFPADVVLDCRNLTSDIPSPSVTGFPLAEDNCDNPVCDITWRDFISTEPGDDPDCPGDTIISRTWTITDGCGNSLPNVQTITIAVQTDGGLCEPELCPQEPCRLCECDLASCDCCAAGGITACTPVECNPVPCTPVECTPVDCIPCELNMDDTLSPAPFCDDETPCIPNIIPVFVDDSDGYTTVGEDNNPYANNAAYWEDKAQYWKDNAMRYMQNNSSILGFSIVLALFAFMLVL